MMKNKILVNKLGTFLENHRNLCCSRFVKLIDKVFGACVVLAMLEC